MGSDEYFHRPFFTKQSPSKLDTNFMDWEDAGHNQNNNVQLSTLSGFMDRSMVLSPQSRNFFTGKNVSRNATSPLNLLSSLKISDSKKSTSLGLFDDFYANSGEEFQANFGSNINKGPVIKHKTGWVSDGKDTCFYFQTTGVAYKRNWKPATNDHSPQLMEIDYKVSPSSPAANNLSNNNLNNTSMMEVSGLASTSFRDTSHNISTPSPVEINDLQKENQAHISQKYKCSFSTIFKTLLFLFSTILFLYGLFHYANNSLFETTDRNCSDFKKLEHDLNSNIFGQHLATKTIYDHLKAFLDEDDHRKVLTMSLHGSTGTGKSYTVQHLTSTFPEEKFLYFSVAKTFKENSVEPNVDKFKQEIQKIVGHSFWSTLFSWEGNCPHFLVLDNMEYASDALTTEIIKVIDSVGELSRASKGKIIIILLSNTGSDIINDIVEDTLTRSNMKRESLAIVDISRNWAFKDRLDNSWAGKMFEKKVIDIIVPFLPLQRSHVEECVIHRIREKKASMSEDLVNRVVNDFQYKGFFSTLGCKKVSAKVDEVIFSNVCKIDSGVTLWDKEALMELCKD